MPETTANAETPAIHPDVANFLGGLHPDIVSNSTVQQLANSGIPLSTFQAGLTGITEIQPLLNATSASQTTVQAQNGGFAALTPSSSTGTETLDVTPHSAPVVAHTAEATAAATTNVTSFETGKPLTTEEVIQQIMNQKLENGGALTETARQGTVTPEGVTASKESGPLTRSA